MLFEPTRALRYRPDLEHEEAGEEESARSVCESLRKVSETTLEHGGHAIRAVHAKSHGIVEGELEVAGDLHPILAQGLFAKPGRHPVVMRFSTIPGDLLDDSVSTSRGLAIKVIGVEGERLPGSEGEVTQDFVLVNGPAFNSPNVKVFATNMKLLAAATDKAQWAKKAFSAVARGLEAGLEAVGGESPTLVTLGGQAETHVLGETYYSQSPFLWGEYVVKISVTPVSDALRALTGKHVDVNGKPHGLREAVIAHFREHGGEWDIRVQLCTDAHEMPIENPHKTWDEDKSPYLPVGRITVAPQTGWSEARSKAVDDGMAFTVWRGLAAHRPLGSVNRARKRAYEMSAAFRAEHNGVPVVDPREAPNLP